LTVNLIVDTLDPPGGFLIAPIRSTDARLCNWEFRRDGHGIVAAVMTLTYPPAEGESEPLRQTAHHACKFRPLSLSGLMLYVRGGAAAFQPRPPDDRELL
jgi:hypothetical protein